MDTILIRSQDSQPLNAKTDDEWVFVGCCTSVVALPRSELPAYLAGYRQGICIFTIIGLVLWLLGSVAVLLISSLF